MFGARQYTFKLIETGQSGTASAFENTLATAHGIEIRFVSSAHAVFTREDHDPAPLAGTNAGDALSDEALEAIRAVGAGSIERQGDGRRLAFGILARSVRLLARVLGFGGDGDVQAGDQVLSGWWIGTDSDQAGSQDREGRLGAESRLSSCEAGLLGWR